MELTDSSATLLRMGAETTTVALDAAVLPMSGRLDGAAGVRLLAAARGAVAAGAIRLDVDLCEVTDFTPAGTAALLACRDLCGEHAGDHGPQAEQNGGSSSVELHYRTSRGPGRDALLAAFAEVRDDLGDGDDVEEGIDDDALTIDLRAL
jgi:hypothetical protein